MSNALNMIYINAWLPNRFSSKKKIIYIFSKLCIHEEEEEESERARNKIQITN